MVLVLCGLVLGLLHKPVFAKEIAWNGFDQGIARSKSENKKIFLHFYANWCGACRIMESKTFKDPAVIAYINENFIPIKVNADREKEAADLFRVRALPDNWFIAEDGKPIGHQPGYITPVQLKGILKMLIEENTGQ
jgi:thiol:disulfide interchange protein